MRIKAPIPFGEWTPDQSIIAGGSPTAKGVLSLAGRYAPLPDLQQIRAASQISDDAIGGFTAYDPDGQPVTFLADASTIYRMQGQLPQNVSKPGGYVASRDWVWSFVQFGSNVLAIARGEQLQRYVLGSSSTFVNVNAAPTGDCVFRIRNQVFIGAGNVVHASAFNNILDWTPSGATQAFSNELNQARGLIVSGWGGEQGVIFQERGMTRLNFLGGSVPYQFDDVEGGRGLVGPNALSEWGRQAFVVAEDGFYLTDGLQVTPIGQNRVDRWFSSQLNYASRHRTWAAIDTERKSWMVGFPSGGSSTPNVIGIYSFADDRWSFDDLDTFYGLEMHREPVNIDDEAGMIALVGTANVDEMTVSFDSPLFRESRKAWGVVNGLRQVCQFAGPSRPATLSTATFEPVPAKKAFVSELYPIIDAAPASVTGQVGSRLNRLNETETLTPASTMTDDGFCPVLTEGRYLRASVSIAAGATWTEATGIHTDASESGER